VVEEGVREVSSGLWLVVAAIAGSLLTLLGTYLNDHLAAQREARRAKQEAEEQQKRWEREDRLKEEEQSEAHRQQVREKRAPAYKAFVVATSFPAPFKLNQRAEYTQELNERYTEVVLYCSATLENDAEALYNSALKALAEPEDDEDDRSRQELRKARAEFWYSVRVEAQEDYSHS
jgi:hypothetical protein